MEQITPAKLFVCICQHSPYLVESSNNYYGEGVPVPAELQAIRQEHIRYMYDISKSGILWLGGPSADYTHTINVFAVDSLEKAREAQQNDPYYVQGLIHNDRYLEWVIHMPLGKASPADREKIERNCRELGIFLDPA